MSAPQSADPGVYISPAQTHAEVRRIADGQIRIEGKLDSILNDQRDHRDSLTDHETRLRRLEAARWPIPSLAAVVSLGALAVSLAPLLQH